MTRDRRTGIEPPAPSTVPAVPDSAQEPTGLPCEAPATRRNPCRREPVPRGGRRAPGTGAALPTPGAGAVPETALAPQEPQAAPEAPRTVQETGAEGAVPGPQQVMEVPEAAQAPRRRRPHVPDAQDAAPDAAGWRAAGGCSGRGAAGRSGRVRRNSPEPQVLEAPEAARMPEEAPAARCRALPPRRPRRSSQAVRTVEEPQAAQAPPAGAAVTADDGAGAGSGHRGDRQPPRHPVPSRSRRSTTAAAEVPPVPEAVDAPAPDATVPQDAPQPALTALPSTGFRRPVGRRTGRCRRDRTRARSGADGRPHGRGDSRGTATGAAAETATATAGPPAVDRVTPESEGTVTGPADGEALALTTPPHQAPAAGGPETSGTPDGTAWTGTAPAPADPVQGPQQTPATPLPGSFPLVPGRGAVPRPDPPRARRPAGCDRSRRGTAGAGADAVPSAAGPDSPRTPRTGHAGTGRGPEAAPPTGPAAPGYDDAEREAVHRVMRERRDIRNGFRTDPIPHEVLLRVLEAAHTAPSVGHSQPWDFVVIRSAETRRDDARTGRSASARRTPSRCPRAGPSSSRN